jgi:hypothetical protein
MQVGTIFAALLVAVRLTGGKEASREVLNIIGPKKGSKRKRI